MSAFEGYLEMGGNELVNNSRTRGIAQSAQPCPMWWLKGPVCATLGDALGQSGEYNWHAIASAPWFDPDLPQSRDFFGFFAHSITQVYDSTRTVPRTEGIGDGGMLGRTRKAMKEVRVKGLLMGRGRLAIEYGQAWLSAAVDPGACGQHGDECGLTDLAWFADCPPERGQVPDGVWVETARNLATNPSFEATSGTVEVRRNYNLNPRMDNSVIGWSVSSGAVQTAAAGGTVLDFPSAVAVNGLLHYQSAAQPGGAVAAAGEFYVGSIDVTVPAEYPALTLRFSLVPYAGGGATPLAPSHGADVTINPGQTVRVNTPIPPTATPATTDGVRTILYARGGGFPAGARLIVADALLEKSPVLGTYFDGTTSPDPDLTPSWTGAANASASVLTGVRPTPLLGSYDGNSFVFQSGQWASAGTKSVRIVPSRANSSSYLYMNRATLGLTVGQTYTAIAKIRLATPQTGALHAVYSRALQWRNGGVTVASAAAPNVAGVHELRITFTVEADNDLLMLGNGAHAGNGDVWWDDLLIVEGEYDGPYFDGATPSDDELLRYRWLGATDASASVEERQALRPQTDEEYAADVLPLVRYLHDTACISGPLITATRNVGEFWAYEVEMTFAAERPWVYGVTRDVALNPATPIIIQDIPYNLAPYPSAELSEGTVIVAENLSTNPSLETNATGWLNTESVIPLAQIASGRVTGELAAVGVASYRRVFTATSGGGPGYFGTYQEVAIAAAQGLRASISLWSAAVIFAGTPTLGALEFYAVWRNGSTVLRTDNLGSVPVAGGAVNAKSIEVPATTTNVLVQARLNVTSWANGNVIRLYTDALAVTVP